ncbi:hypothetical protein AAZX31_03G196300 [Glycine max]|nr:nuclear polyadenylated RNA-binding protein 3 [Glycine max]XP_028226276.1 nuclear polyadenylated RNA-binding protein 3-like [Glycine soja]KAG4394016.1 hypothetical protein GLYMA_03G216500v4 [Glycine max]KAG5072955.1 hypothetical protein JHK86_008166 [Glycine max]KAH1071183.1 hypothetical protein GYH30_007973 [Glycine max]RZC21822.1 hypothetical protein D0Y65_007849 [Glycine soja]|eukprot:XP_006577156.1 nuclear polyadenylated RNA-binding protein 3 [Glycine max]
MEDKRTAITNNQARKKIHPLIRSLSIGGEGGIAGLVVFGGALAIAGFMAVASFASNKNKAKDTHDDHQPPKPKPKPQQLLLEEHICKSEEDHDTTQSLTSLIQHGDSTCCWASNMSKTQVSDSSESLSVQSLILEEKNELKARSVEESPTDFHHQEIVFSDSSHPESAASSNEGGVAEECMMSLLNSPSGQDEEPQDDSTSSETETVTEDDDIKDDDDDDDEMLSDDVSEIGEQDGSKVATGTTSMEPVWPEELIQHAKQKFKGDSHVCSDSEVDGSDDLDEAMMTVANQATMNQNLNFFMVPNNQPLTTWVFPFLLLALLLILVLLTRRPQESFYVLDEGTTVVKRI